MTNKSVPVELKKQTGNVAAGAGLHNAFRSLRQQIDRMIEDFDRVPFSSHWLDMAPFTKLRADVDVVVPAIDVVDEANCYKVTAELPGLSEKNIEVTKEGDLLTIKGEKREEREQKEKGYFISERHYGSFERSLRLPDGIEDAKIEAKFENGVLTVTLPKTAAAMSTPKKITVKAA